MPLLFDPRHERYCQLRAKGVNQTEAYEQAGFKRSRSSASALEHRDDISERIAEIVRNVQAVHEQANTKAINKLAITKERILARLAQIAFGDVRKVIKWHGSQVEEEDNPDGGDALVIRHTYTNAVLLVSSDEIDDETAGSIASVKQTANGIEVKQHDPIRALELLGKELGMFADHSDVDIRQYVISDQPLSPEEWAKEHATTH